MYVYVYIYICDPELLTTRPATSVSSSAWSFHTPRGLELRKPVWFYVAAQGQLDLEIHTSHQRCLVKRYQRSSRNEARFSLRESDVSTTASMPLAALQVVAGAFGFSLVVYFWIMAVGRLVPIRRSPKSCLEVPGPNLGKHRGDPSTGAPIPSWRPPQKFKIQRPPIPWLPSAKTRSQVQGWGLM